MRKKQGKIKNEALKRRARRVLAIRKRIVGTPEIPRVCVTKSKKHLRVQVIDDQDSKTLFSVQTYGKNAVGSSKNKESAKLLGVKVGEGLKAKNIEKVVFDRAGFRYGGVLAVIADSIREKGIQL